MMPYSIALEVARAWIKSNAEFNSLRLKTECWSIAKFKIYAFDDGPEEREFLAHLFCREMVQKGWCEKQQNTGGE